MNSKTIQKKIVAQVISWSHKVAVQNFYLFKGWECDVVTVDRDNYIHEFEVKISRNDFHKDFLKKNKHDQTSNGYGGANYFTYVAPEGIIELEDVPEYAGLMTVNKMGWLKTVKKAPQLHTEKINEGQWEEIACKLFWLTM